MLTYSFEWRSNVKRLIRLPEVISTTGLSRSTIYALSKVGKFPKGIPTGPRTTCWDSDAVAAWVNARIAQAGQETAGRMETGRRLLEARKRKGELTAGQVAT